VKRLMKELHGGSVKSIIEELVRLTGHCRTTEERLAILEPYLEKRLQPPRGSRESLGRRQGGSSFARQRTES